MNWFKRKPKDAVPPAPYQLSDSSEKAYRIDRIKEIAGILDRPLAETAERLDVWVIREASGSVGDEPVMPMFIPHPLWDDEWLLTRSSYPTREQAEAHIHRVGGTLLPED
ncbi:hypothetical protein SEA_BIG4_58 [Microbacterium phage Big4]|nr:hypothetical protein SEA_BIG4_58 [Microbacterium phage Big4]